MINTSYAHSIDTDAAIGTILSNFDSDYIKHVIQDSLRLKFRPFSDPMPNYVDIYRRQFISILEAGPDYRDEILKVEQETYQEIIQMICQFYGLSFTSSFDNISPDNTYTIAHTMYDVFISRFTDYMIDFFINYIINNSDSIYSYLIADETVIKPQPKDQSLYQYINDKFALVNANINKVISNMASYDITLDELFSYFFDPNTASYYSNILEDIGGDIYRTHYAYYITNHNTYADIVTTIKLKLQARTISMIKL